LISHNFLGNKIFILSFTPCLVSPAKTKVSSQAAAIGRENFNAPAKGMNIFLNKMS